MRGSPGPGGVDLRQRLCQPVAFTGWIAIPLVTCQPPLPHRAGPECRAVPDAAAAEVYSPASWYRSHLDRGRGGSARLPAAQQRAARSCPDLAP